LEKKLNKIKICILFVSVTIFLASLTQTALTYNDHEGLKTHSALSLLFMGAFAILGGGLLEWLIWLANPLYLLALILLLRPNKTSRNVSMMATMLALSFVTWQRILASESGSTAAIKSLNTGYWLWMMSLMTLTVGTFYYFRQLDKFNKAHGKSKEQQAP